MHAAAQLSKAARPLSRAKTKGGSKRAKAGQGPAPEYIPAKVNRPSTHGFLGPYNPIRIFVYVTLFLTAMSTLLVYDLLNGGPCGELLTPLVNYALPLMDDPDLGRNVEELVRSRNFEFERHNVTTEDGYIIEMHRVYNTNFSNNIRPALVFGLPLFCSSAVSLVDYRNNTPGA
ncbi:lipase member K-like [Tropilaelaps mercedesae]|uniref:Lipase member K-like n=1 Tax=Tropilaelaps mercedesae TaxID=418985 RepID=A0A1V9XYE9_9ACAR|nr:lipase member K-like [Tropilaelaps mercedesae]